MLHRKTCQLAGVGCKPKAFQIVIDELGSSVVLGLAIHSSYDAKRLFTLAL